jgi:hypothetical protein
MRRHEKIIVDINASEIPQPFIAVESQNQRRLITRMRRASLFEASPYIYKATTQANHIRPRHQTQLA